MMDTTTLFVTVAATVVGSGLGTALVGALLSRRFNTQLETHKALLQRSGRIHEKQVDCLLEIHSKLEEALFYFQRAASAGKLKGQAPDEELLNRMAHTLGDASKEFSKKRLLVSEKLGRNLDEFFKKSLSGAMNLNMALDPMMSELRAKLWNEAGETAYNDLPQILEAIRKESRIVIHG
jgi:hypothetical protein